MVKKKARRKIVRMFVSVSVPDGTSAADARREVRSLISDQCNFALDEGDVRCLAAKPIPKEAAVAMLATDLFVKEGPRNG